MLFRAENIFKFYQSHLNLFQKRKVHTVLNGIDIEICGGEIVGLVGESGCGKSTLARVLSGVEMADEGTIFLDGLVVNRAMMRTFHKSCQIIFQDTLSSLNPSLKIESILMEPLKNYYSFSKEEARARICEMLEKVQLSHSCLERYPHELSGGERQRVNILRALLLEPKLLICDEIVSSVDITVQKSIVDLLLALNKKENMAILFISHDLGVTRYLSDRILVMEKGKVVESIDRGENSWCHSATKKLFESQLIRHPNERNLQQSMMIK